MNEKEVQILNETGTFRNLPIKGTMEETHISWVIMGKSHVFKIKKKLKLSFLDFPRYRNEKNTVSGTTSQQAIFSNIPRRLACTHRKWSMEYRRR